MNRYIQMVLILANGFKVYFSLVILNKENKIGEQLLIYFKYKNVIYISLLHNIHNFALAHRLYLFINIVSVNQFWQIPKSMIWEIIRQISYNTVRLKLVSFTVTKCS